MTRDPLALDPSEILALARAVMGPGRHRVLHINADNNGDGWASLREAVQSGRAFTARYRTDLLCLDADSERTADLADALADALGRLGYRPVVWASGRPGHRQVVVHIPEAAVRLDWEEKARECGIDVRRDSRPPLSPHRLGLPVALIAPGTVEEALDALRAPVGGTTARRPA